MTTKSHVQIMAGNLRHRKVQFMAVNELRPTAVRVRETLFNWLQPHLVGSTCLDLFAGSGILGFEAISRGAKQVTFVEKQHQVVTQLRHNIALFSLGNAIVKQGDYADAIIGRYDVVFLDPPYVMRLLPHLLQQVKRLSPQCVFIEDGQPFEQWVSEQGYYTVLKSKKAGSIYYGLLSPIQA
ncbi:MAG: 16S rRNA (guanine(966)-N(2))-methyltransferase RsmD [Ostreibacterium sp.]